MTSVMEVIRQGKLQNIATHGSYVEVDLQPHACDRERRSVELEMFQVNVEISRKSTSCHRQGNVPSCGHTSLVVTYPLADGVAIKNLAFVSAMENLVPLSNVAWCLTQSQCKLREATTFKQCNYRCFFSAHNIQSLQGWCQVHKDDMP